MFLGRQHQEEEVANRFRCLMCMLYATVPIRNVVVVMQSENHPHHYGYHPASLYEISHGGRFVCGHPRKGRYVGKA